MNDSVLPLIEKLAEKGSLSLRSYATLVEGYNPDVAAIAAKIAREKRREVYGDLVFIRGLIEISNICRNDCYYCGIRKSNANCERYFLSEEEILSCCQEGFELGFRTFVLQGGESSVYSVEKICELSRNIKSAFPSCALTLSLGEYPYAAYKSMREVGVDRYLLRHETANARHYASLHPSILTLSNRMRCLKDLKELGFQAGCGFMVGSPGQTPETLAEDLKFIETFTPEMCGIGPFIPHRNTPFKNMPAGSPEMTAYLLSILRIMHPNLLLPATTALASLGSDGRTKGILAGANVVMPNLSPFNKREKYSLYNNKASSGEESAQNLDDLKRSIQSAGCDISLTKGDYIPLS